MKDSETPPNTAHPCKRGKEWGAKSAASTHTSLLGNGPHCIVSGAAVINLRIKLHQFTQQTSLQKQCTDSNTGAVHVREHYEETTNT